MTKIFSGGALIPYGDTLPTTVQAADGELFLRTNSGAQSGLWLFGIIRDANSGLIGPQVSQNWTQISFSSSNFVQREGDIMTGVLEVPTLIRITQNASPSRLILGNQDSLGVNRPAVVEGVNGNLRLGTGNTWAGSGGSMATFLGVDASIDTGLTFRGNQVWHAANDGPGTGLDADLLDSQQGTFYRNASNVNAGVLSTAFGGTGSSGPYSTGGIIYSSATTVLTSTSAGTASQVLLSGGAGAPTWANQSALSVGNATFAVTATNATNATNAVTATNATNAANVPWTGVSGLPTAQQTFSNNPAANFTTYARPALFYDMGAAGGLSMTPNQFQSNSISGFTAYSTSDIGQYQTGLTVVAADGLYGFQLAANWDFGEAAPTGLRFRVNDDTGVIGAWGAFRTIWDSGNLTNLNQLTNGPGYITSSALGSYVAKTGDTMTGGLFAPSLAIGSVSMPGAGSINVAGNIISVGIVSSGDGAGSLGSVRLQPSPNGNTGYIEFWAGNGIRSGYIGNASAPGTNDTGLVNYIAATHSFSGNMTVSGNITAQGNVTAFSDIRLKTNIKPIDGALARVKALNGVTFDRVSDSSRGTGLIAQEVQTVLPEAVIENEDGMLSVAYGNMVGLLVQTIKEQQSQIEELKEQVDRLIRLVG